MSSLHRRAPGLSVEEIRHLEERVANARGRLVPIVANAGDLTSCLEVHRQLIDRWDGRLDLLVCNACPPLRALWLEPAAVGRIVTHVTDSVAMVATPMAVLLPLVAKAGGWNVVISSSAVVDPPADWPHYVAAKQALEGLVRVAAEQYPDVRSVIVRPPRLRTDLTNTIGASRAVALAPEQVARELLRQLGGAVAGKVEVLDRFGA